ncbi:hypothetical protein pb186bvf_009193 [Paramecium bursaria]
MLSKQTQQILQQYFDHLENLEIKVEQKRNLLCRMEDFEPYSIYIQLFKGNQIDIDVLKQQYPLMPLQGLAAIILFFNRNRDGVLTYEDFYNIVVVHQDKSVRQWVSNRQVKNTNNEILLRLVRDIFQTYSNGFIELQQIKVQLQEQYDFDMIDCLNYIKLGTFATKLCCLNGNQIDFKSIYKLFYSKNNYIIQLDEIEKVEEDFKYMNMNIKIKEDPRPISKYFFTPVRQIHMKKKKLELYENKSMTFRHSNLLQTPSKLNNNTPLKQYQTNISCYLSTDYK